MTIKKVRVGCVLSFLKCVSGLVICLFTSQNLSAQERILDKERTFSYLTLYSDSANMIFIRDTIWFTTTKIPWKPEPGVQQTVIWNYPRPSPDAMANKHIYSIGWVNLDSTGAIENERKFWIHPPRHNQFSITEVAPFPYAALPCEMNKKFSNITYTGKGWGDWENLKLNNRYEYTGHVTREIGSTQYDCWMIRSESDSVLGISSLTTLFNEKIGFAEFDYTFYNNIRIRIILFKIE